MVYQHFNPTDNPKTLGVSVVTVMVRVKARGIAKVTVRINAMAKVTVKVRVKFGLELGLKLGLGLVLKSWLGFFTICSQRRHSPFTVAFTYCNTADVES